MPVLMNKVAIVTGSAQGIGKEIAQRYIAEGAKVVIADKDIEKATLVATELCPSGERALSVQVDVACEDEVKSLMDQTLNRFGTIDILVNNAGIQPPKQAFYEITAATWDKTFDVNVKGTFLCSKAVAPIFLKQGFGTIINTSSVAGLFLWEGSLHYIATKAAINEMTRTMALELSAYNIHVNAVAPGHVDTQLNNELLSPEGSKARIEQSIPLGRIAVPSDLSGAYVFLASDKAKYITGHILYVDGGLTQIK